MVPSTLRIDKSVIQNHIQYVVRTDFLAFVKYECHMKVGPHHHVWWDHIRDMQHTIELAPRDHGKLLKNKELCLTTEGWKEFGDVHPGDYVYHPSGTPVKVVWEGSYGLANKRVHFKDGSYIDCHEHHEWTVLDRKTIKSMMNRGDNYFENWWEYGHDAHKDMQFRNYEISELKANGWKVKNIAEKFGIAESNVYKILKDPKAFNNVKNIARTYETKDIEEKLENNRFFIPYTKPVEFEPTLTNTTFDIPPYLMGYLLGDGNTRDGIHIASHKDDIPFLLKKFKDLGFTYTTRGTETNIYCPEISPLWKKLNLHNGKFIPEIYKLSSIEDRVELIRGLIDSDGTVREDGSYMFTNTNELLVDGLREVLNTLGIKNFKRDKHKSNNSWKDSWNVIITSDIRLSNMERKYSRAKHSSKERFLYSRYMREIIKIEDINPEPGKCIQVNCQDGLFLAGKGLIPTHNSHALARLYPIWRAKYHGKYYKEVVLLGGDKTAAQYNLSKIKEIILGNKALKHLFPNHRSLKNSDGELHLTNGVKFFARGYQSRIRGRHPQLIILDDVLSEANSLTEDMRQKTKAYFFGVVFPMADKGIIEAGQVNEYKSQIVVVGTAQHYKDLYHDLLDNPDFRGAKLRAITDEEDKEVLWPERYTHQDLINIRRTAGSLHFSKEYMNEPISDDTALFPPYLFEPLKDEDLSYVRSHPGNPPTYMGVDFNIPGDSADDYTVITTSDYSNNIFTLRDVRRFKATDANQQIRAIKTVYDVFRVSGGMYEDNMFQALYGEMLDKSNVYLSGHTVTWQSKNSIDHGILAFRALLENRRIIFPYKTDVDKEMTDLIIQEFGGIVRRNGKIGNMAFHDDIVMALWHMITAAGNDVFSYSFLDTERNSFKNSAEEMAAKNPDSPDSIEWFHGADAEKYAHLFDKFLTYQDS